MPAVTTTPAPSTAPVPGSARLTTAQLKARLLTQADLSGYAPSAPPGNFPSHSDKAAWVAVLNDLSSASAPRAAVTQVQTAGQAASSADRVVRAVQVGEGVSDERHRNQPAPPPPPPKSRAEPAFP